MTNQNSFLNVFSSAARSPEIPPEDDVYGWLIGGWDLDVVLHDEEGNAHESRGEAHFGWVLEGRAVQDVFVNPRRSERTSDLPKTPGNWYGSTFRMYDPSIRAWRVTWTNPVNGTGASLIGRWNGKDIVQEGKYSDQSSIRWTFTDITADSFRWFGERLEGNGWRLQAEFRARRLK